MVTHDYVVVMTSRGRVGVAELKARLSAYLRSARRGNDVVIHDRNEPIARLVPYAATDSRLVVREPAGRYGALGKIPLPRPVKTDLNVVDLLLEERRGR